MICDFHGFKLQPSLQDDTEACMCYLCRLTVLLTQLHHVKSSLVSQCCRIVMISNFHGFKVQPSPQDMAQKLACSIFAA